MDCRELNKQIFSYCDRNLDDPVCREVEEHLAHCESCSLNADYTCREQEALSYAGDIPAISTDLTARIMARVASEGSIPTKDSRFMPSRNRILGLSGAAAGLVIALAASWYYYPALYPRTANQATQNVPAESRLKIAAKQDVNNKTIERLAQSGISNVAIGQAPSPTVTRDGSPPKTTVAEPVIKAKIPAGAPVITAAKPVEPSYIPSGYKLAVVEESNAGGYKLAYNNQSGDTIQIQVLPVMLKESAASAAAPAAPQPLMMSALSASGSAAGGQPENTAEESEKMKAFSAPAARSMSSAAPAAVYGLADSAAAGHVIAFVIHRNNQAYRVEVAGNASQDDINRVSDSMK